MTAVGEHSDGVTMRAYVREHCRVVKHRNRRLRIEENPTPIDLVGIMLSHHVGVLCQSCIWLSRRCVVRGETWADVRVVPVGMTAETLYTLVGGPVGTSDRS